MMNVGEIWGDDCWEVEMGRWDRDEIWMVFVMSGVDEVMGCFECGCVIYYFEYGHMLFIILYMNTCYLLF